uniref:Aminotransferase-like plant mobile domain-containing protein n=1 Tax=Solanum tuberosum TaxID=4113 RepID=M1BMX6_SOLTU
MVFFKDYTCPSSQLKYLIVGTEGSTVETKFLVQDSFVGRYVDPWPQLRNTLHMRSWTSEYDHKSNKASKAWYLDKPNPQCKNIASTLSNLGRRMILEELCWGDNIVLEGEYHYILGYWEWTEDVLSKNGQSLNNACISDAVFASFFTYDRNYNIIQAFCEAWCPQTNTLLTSIGETSISLWDLHILGGLPISGVPYEEVIPNSTELTGNFIWPETFKIASLMASGKRVSLAVPVLASIYHGLNKISNSSQLDHIRVCFPIHYVYGWLAYYLKTHYPLTSGPSLPRMVVYSGEGAAKYFDKDEARKRVHWGESIVWNATILSRPHPTYYIDDGKAPELELAYFMSLRFNYLPLRRGGSFVIEPYSPHRFSRQFGFHQDIPGYLENDIRAESLDEGLRYWRICISRATMSKVTFPPAVTSAKKLYTTQYSSWWERSYGMVLEDNLDVMVEKAGSEFVTLLEDKSQDIEKTLSKVPVLASIYHGLNKISNSSQLDHIRVCFPIHYVYGWLAYYLKTHYPLTSGPSLPRMVVYSGEGAAKYFDKDEARKRVHRGESIVWNATMLSRPHPTYYIDDGKAPELELAYFMSLRFNYLPLRRGGSFVIEPYSPHRFSCPFGFHQDIPGYLENDIRVESPDEGLRYWHICISRATMSKATFPPAVTSAKKLYTTQYSSWWERSYGMVLEDNLDFMVEKAGSEFVTLLEDKIQDIEKTLSKVKTPLAPQHQSKKLNSSKVSKKEVVHTSTDKEKCPQFLFSSKRALQETSKTSKDRCWKRQRVEPSGAEVVDLRVVEVQSVDSPSRSMTIQSDKAQSISNIEQEQKTSSTSRGQTLKGLTHNSNGFSRVLPKSNGAMSVFEGKGVVFNHKRKYILGLWEEICGKLSRTSLDNISSYKNDICEIFKEMSEMNLLDLSPLKSLVDSLFDHATSYDQEHSNFVDKAYADKKMELISNAKGRLELFKVKRVRRQNMFLLTGNH